MKKLYEGDDSHFTKQWKFYIKKSVKGLATDLLRNDFKKTYKVDYNELMKMIEKKIFVPGFLKHEKTDLEKYVQHWFDKSVGKIDYRDMI